MEILEIIILLIINFFSLWLINYLQQKGKNLATKEDVGKITEKIEEVKTIYKHSYDLKKTEMSFYNEMIEEFEEFLNLLKKHKLEFGNEPNNEDIMKNENLKSRYLNFLDSANKFLAKAFIFLNEESYENIKKTIVVNKNKTLKDYRLDFLDAMRKSIYPD